MRTCCHGMDAISLTKTLKRVCKSVQCTFKTNINVKSCTADPEDVRPGDVYFAIADYEDLEEHVDLAIHHGCSAVVANRPVSGVGSDSHSLRSSVPFFIVPNVGECYAAVCQALYDDPAMSLKMIAVTGTSGKTSTSYLVCAVLAEAGYQVGLIGSLGIFDGTMLHPTNELDLQPPQLAAWLHQMMMNGCTHVVVEVPTEMLVQGHLGGIKFDAVCLTNIRRDCLKHHKTIEEYRRCKLGIFRYAKKHALAVCNIDDQISEAVMPLIEQPMLSVGIRNHAEVGSLLVQRSAAEQVFLVTAGTEAVPYQTRVIGDNHIYNCLTATALAIGLEVDIKTVARGIGRVENVPGRMEKIECGQDFNVYIDSARTIDSFQAVLRTVREVTPGRLICVFGTANHHEESRREKFAKALESHADSVILTSATECMDAETASAACDIGSCFSSDVANGVETKIVPNRAEAVALGLEEAKSGDTVLIFGRGTSMGAPFCDRMFTKQWLQETTAARTANV